MQIILKELPEQSGVWCLYDTRSEKFVPGAGVNNPNDNDLLNLANNLVRKSPRTILGIVQNWEYNDDYGYAEAMFAKAYLQLNTDLKEKAKLSIAEKPIRKSRIRKEKAVDIDPETGKERIKVRGKAGRPKKVWTAEELAEIEAKKNRPKLGRGRPKKAHVEKKPIVLINGVPRKRGRPSAASLAMMTITY